MTRTARHDLNHHWLLLAALATIGFALLAWLKQFGPLAAMDRYLLLLMQTGGEHVGPGGPAWLREAGRDLTALGSMSVLILSTVAALGWLWLLGLWRSGVLALAAISGGTALSFLLKMFFSRPRPDLLSEPVQVFTSSFPSSHAMASLVTYFILGWLVGRGLRSVSLRRYVIFCALGVSLIAGLSRVYLGVHWPSDVIAGWLAGLAWLALCAWLLTGKAGDWAIRDRGLASPPTA